MPHKAGKLAFYAWQPVSEAEIWPQNASGSKAMPLYLMEEKERHENRLKNGQSKRGGQEKDGRKQEQRRMGFCVFPRSVRRKTKRRVRGPWDEIIPGNLERNFLKHRLGSLPFVAGLAVWSSPRTASSPATSLSLAAICMASNERVLMLVSRGWVMALHTGLRS